MSLWCLQIFGMSAATESIKSNEWINSGESAQSTESTECRRQARHPLLSQTLRLGIEIDNWVLQRGKENFKSITLHRWICCSMHSQA